jgi:hypothetical protein
MTRHLYACPVALLVALTGCNTAEDDVGGSEAAQTEGSAFSPYPTEIRAGMKRLDPFDPQNASVGDFATKVRDQGSIGSCASFGFLGLLENQLFNDRGISPDLSERFMLFSNFFQVGTGRARRRHSSRGA